MGERNENFQIRGKNRPIVIEIFFAVPHLEPGRLAQCRVAPRTSAVRHAEPPSRWTSETRKAEAQSEAR